MYPGKFLLTLALCFSIPACFAQKGSVFQGYSAVAWGKEMDPRLIKLLKATTVVFFYRKEDEDDLDVLKTAVTKAWKFTPVIVADISDFNKYNADPSFSLFTLNNPGMANRASSESLYLTLYVPKEGGRRRTRYVPLCAMDLSPDLTGHSFEHRFPVMAMPFDDVIPYKDFYNEVKIRNWTPASLSIYLQLINAAVEQGRTPNRLKTWADTAEMHLVRNDTLFIPDYVLVHVNIVRGTNGDPDDHLFDNYPYKYKICTREEMNDRFITGNSGRFMFDYVKNNAGKTMCIYDMTTGKIIYRALGFGANLNDTEVKSIFTDRHGRPRE